MATLEIKVDTVVLEAAVEIKEAKEEEEVEPKMQEKIFPHAKTSCKDIARMGINAFLIIISMVLEDKKKHKIKLFLNLKILANSLNLVIMVQTAKINKRLANFSTQISKKR